MELLTPGVRELGRQAKANGTFDELHQRCFAIIEKLAAELADMPNGVLMLDIVSSAFMVFAITGLAELAKKQDGSIPLDVHMNNALSIKTLALWKLLKGANTEKFPFCCEAHLIQGVSLDLLKLLASPDNGLVACQILAVQLTSGLKPENFSAIDKIVDRAATKLQQDCYNILYGSEAKP